jgi:hypothetical protein
MGIVRQNSTFEVAFRWSCKLRGGNVPHHASTTIDVPSDAEAAIGQAEIGAAKTVLDVQLLLRAEWTNALNGGGGLCRKAGPQSLVHLRLCQASGRAP